jgi:hypothetical protein
VITRGLCELTLESRQHRAPARSTTMSWDSACSPMKTTGCGWHAATKSRLGVWSVGEKEFGDRDGRHVRFAFSVSRGGLAAIAERLGQLGLSSQGPAARGRRRVPVLGGPRWQRGPGVGLLRIRRRRAQRRGGTGARSAREVARNRLGPAPQGSLVSFSTFEGFVPRPLMRGRLRLHGASANRCVEAVSAPPGRFPR